MPGTTGAIPEEGGRQPEVGKVWERGRNWTSVVMEVAPGMLPGAMGTSLTAAVEKNIAKKQVSGDSGDGSESESVRDDAEEEDEDVIEVPIFVRVNYETDPGGAAAEERREGAQKESREIEFWTVLGLGRISS